MVLWQIVLIIIVLIIVYIIYILLTGKSRRKKIFYPLIRSNYINHKGEVLPYDFFHYEAAEKFVQEFGGYSNNDYSSVNIPFDDNNKLLIQATFTRDTQAHITLLEVEDVKYAEEKEEEMLNAMGDILKEVVDYEDKKRNSFNLKVQELKEAAKWLEGKGKEATRTNFKNIGEIYSTIEKMDIKRGKYKDITCIEMDGKTYGIYVSENSYIDMIDFDQFDPVEIEWFN